MMEEIEGVIESLDVALPDESGPYSAVALALVVGYLILKLVLPLIRRTPKADEIKPQPADTRQEDHDTIRRMLQEVIELRRDVEGVDRKVSDLDRALSRRRT